MSRQLHAKPRPAAVMILKIPPKVHAPRVKLENAKKSLYIGKKKNSLSCFTCSPLCARVCVYAWACATPGESWETWHDHISPALSQHAPTFAPCGVLRARFAKDPKNALGPTDANVAPALGSPPAVGTSRPTRRPMARGNSPPINHSLFCLSELFSGEI
jgi:hypothetical protein